MKNKMFEELWYSFGYEIGGGGIGRKEVRLNRDIDEFWDYRYISFFCFLFYGIL